MCVVYSSYKYIGQKWVLEIPEHWEIKRLKAIFSMRTERNSPVVTDNILSLTAKQGVVPYSKKEGVGGNKPKDDLSKYNIARENDLIVNCMNVVSGAAGVSRYFGAISPVYYALYLRAEENVWYYHHIFRLLPFQRSLIGLGKGILMHESDSGKLNTVRMRISMDYLGNVLLPVPPRFEQDQIVRFLDWKVSSINKLISVKRKQRVVSPPRRADKMANNNLIPYEDIYSEIKETLLLSRNQAYSAVNFAMVQAYWQIGRIIVEHEQDGNARAGYGKSVLQELSNRLTKDFGKGFSVRTLQQMKKFYVMFPNTNALRSQLTWTHYRLLLSVENEQARQWYMDEAIASAWSSRQLERQISTLYYERLLASRDQSPVKAEADELTVPLVAENFIRDPYVLEFLDLKNYPALRESDLEQALLDKLQEFLLELGRGFCFVARQKLMRYEDEDFYLDLVFYHSILKCHVLIDLKIGKLTHGDIGQMDSYIRMFDALYKNEDDNPTIGIILCSQKNEAIVKYSVLNDAQQVFASRYRLTLPSAEELQHEIEAERKRIEEQEE